MQRVNEKDGGDGMKRPPVALLHAESHRREAWRFGSLRIRSSQRGRRASMRSFKDVVDEDARIDFSSRQISFMEYGEKWIKLPDKITVPVKKASLQHLRFQEQTIVHEHVKQMKAFITHHENLLVPLIKAMEDNQFETAGEAIHYLMR